MKHAFIITAYKDFELLRDMVTVYTEKFGIDCYIHIDRRTKNKKPILSELNKLPGVKAISIYKTNWGGYKHPLSIIRLIGMAKKNGYDYYHVISANTFVTVNPLEFNAFFEEHSDVSAFMECISFKGTESESDLRRWYEYWHYPHIYDKKGKHHVFWDNVEYYGIKIQKKLGLKRSVDFDFKGFVYCHLRKDTVEYVLDYLKKNREYYRKIKYCHVGEEFFFQNIIMNSGYSSAVHKDNLIYDDWSPERERPAILVKKDLNEIMTSGSLFARKIENHGESKELYEAIKEKILK